MVSDQTELRERIARRLRDSAGYNLALVMNEGEADFLADAVLALVSEQIAEHAAVIENLIKVGTGEVGHFYNGECPDSVDGPNNRDPDCPACAALSSVDAAAILAERDARVWQEGVNALALSTLPNAEPLINPYKPKENPDAQ